MPRHGTRFEAGLVVSGGNDLHRDEKETVVADLVEQLRSTESLIVADYRGLTNADLMELRSKVRGSGGRFQVVKNTLTRRAAEEAGTKSLLALLDGPTAIAFVETEGDPVAVAKALADTGKDTKVLTLRGGILSGRTLTGDDVEELAKLPAEDQSEKREEPQAVADEHEPDAGSSADEPAAEAQPEGGDETED